MLRYALDTNIISAAFWPDPPGKLIKRLESHALHCALPVPVYHELRYGIERLPTSRRRALLERFVNEVVVPSYPLLPYDKPAAEWQAAERARLEKAGHVTPILDSIIASIAVVNGLLLVTDNTADFRHFHGLNLENWLR